MNDETQYTDFVLDDTVYKTTVTSKFRKRKVYTHSDPKKILCVIPGIVQKIFVTPNEKVAERANILVVEAMKMQNVILSPTEGKVKTVHVKIGDMVTKGQLLVELE